MTLAQLKTLIREEVRKTLYEDEYVKNKKTGNVYKVKKLDPAKHEKPKPAEVKAAKSKSTASNSKPTASKSAGSKASGKSETGGFAKKGTIHKTSTGWVVRSGKDEVPMNAFMGMEIDRANKGGKKEGKEITYTVIQDKATGKKQAVPISKI